MITVFIILAVTALGCLPGILLVLLCWPRNLARTDFGLVAAIGCGLGLGLTSAIFFACSLLTPKPAACSLAMEASLACALAWLAWRRRNPPRAPSVEPTVVADRAVAVPWLLAGAAALVVAAEAYQAEPHGGWDGWAIWNMHARFMARGGSSWPQALAQPPLSWTHPDYPLLVPASVARIWADVGDEPPLASGLVSMLFGAATVGVLIGAANRLRNSRLARVAGLVLVGTPSFVRFSAQQHADIPLGFFVLTSIALLTLADGRGGLLFLAGLSAGFAAWTKNEGLLFCVVVAGVYGAVFIRRRSPASLAWLAAGLAVALFPVVCFKLQFASLNDILAGQGRQTWERVREAGRHGLILRSACRDLRAFGEWHWLPFLPLALVLVGPLRRRLHGIEWAVPTVLILMLAGYYCVYLVSPFDLTWHLDSSLVRLLLQLWPLALLTWCLAAPATEHPGGDCPPAVIPAPEVP